MSAQLRKYAAEVFRNYKEYCEEFKCHTVDFEKLPDFVKHEFAAKIMMYQPDRIVEATGPDNNNYFTRMVPTLIEMLGNSTSVDESIDFVAEWKENITLYFKDDMESLLKRAEYDFNFCN